MATSNTTLTSLWIDDGQNSPYKSTVGTASKMASNGSELKDDVLKFYKEAGLEPVAKEAGILDANGELLSFKSEFGTQVKHAQIEHLVAVPVPSGSPSKFETYISSPSGSIMSAASPVILSTPQRMIHVNQVVTPKGTMIATPISMDSSPQAWGASSGRKRQQDLDFSEFVDSGKRRKGEKGGKGLRHFSMKVCEKVQKKGTTSYNEVADELVTEFTDPRTFNHADATYDQKNIRRRVYDALNVLMAMNIISKEKKEIRWLGLPTNSAQECQNLELEKQRRRERIKHKTQQLQELILQQIAFKNLVTRNKQGMGAPTANSAIQLPFIIVNTSKKTVIDCSISNDKYEYLFNFDNTFEIHDDIEVLKRMGMAYGLEKGQCSIEDLKKAVKMVPKALEPYVIEQANSSTSGIPSILTGPSSLAAGIPATLTATASAAGETSLDAEVAMATARGLSRQSSICSFSDIVSARDSPEDEFSESDSERSSPVDMN